MHDFRHHNFFPIIGYIIGRFTNNFILAVNWLRGLQGQGQTVPLNTKRALLRASRGKQLRENSNTTSVWTSKIVLNTNLHLGLLCWKRNLAVSPAFPKRYSMWILLKKMHNDLQPFFFFVICLIFNDKYFHSRFQ